MPPMGKPPPPPPPPMDMVALFSLSFCRKALGIVRAGEEEWGKGTGGGEAMP